MNGSVTIPYNDGTVSVPKYSRIKIYHKSLGSIRGFIIGEDKDKLYLLIPYYPNRFYEGIVEGKEESFNKRDVKGFAFYPEVTVLETRNSQTDKGGPENDNA